MIYGSEQPQKRRLFVSFHHADQAYRNAFDELYKDLFISMSVDYGDIEPANTDEHIKRLVQEDHIVHSSVVVALYGAGTGKRKHVDWELSAALSEKVGGRKGLVIMILPTFPVVPFNASNQYDETLLYPYLHPRTVANIKSGYAKVYFWPGLHSGHPSMSEVQMTNIINEAATKRESHPHLIDNSAPQYSDNIL